jgi:hypothetical protein
MVLIWVGTAAATNVSGPITSDTTWTIAGSPYIVTGNVLVGNGVALTIEPGVTVKFDSDKSLQIDGTLIAIGTSDNRITFTSNEPTPAPGDWGYILFSDASTDALYDASDNYISGSILEHCIVEYAGGVNVTNNAALIIDNAYPFILHTTVQYNSASGIRGMFSSVGYFKIDNSFIHYNNSNSYAGGIYVGSGGGTVIKIVNSLISHNISKLSGGGLSIVGRGTVYVINNTIIDNLRVPISAYKIKSSSQS